MSVLIADMEVLGNVQPHSIASLINNDPRHEKTCLRGFVNIKGAD